MNNTATVHTDTLSSKTICAPATPPGGAIALIRCSGSRVVSIVDTIFSKDISNAEGYTLHHGEIRDNAECIDDVIVSVFRAPHSYTGEDCIEIACHGSAFVVNRLLTLLTEHGCSMAEPGEFTMRAFLNGKMDLSQAEAVADIIAAKNKTTHDIAFTQMRGQLTSTLHTLRKQLLKLTSLLELELDFADHEELEFADRGELLTLAETIHQHITQLAQSFHMGEAIKNGIPVAIIGKTNVGKSTLLNLLIRDDRAIVSDIHGTTRDTIEDTIDLNGITLRLIDTAGLRQTEDKIEQIGIQRTYNAIEKAQIVIWVMDSVPDETELRDVFQRCNGKTLIAVWNKSDLSTPPLPHLNNMPLIVISAKHQQGIQQLEESINKAAKTYLGNTEDVIITNARHYEALLQAQTNLQRVIEGLQTQQTSELIAEDFRMKLNNLADITGDGLITSQETLNNIFTHFCMGK